MDQNINDSKPHIWNSFFFFWKYYFSFRHATFYIRPHVSVDINWATYSFAQKTSLFLWTSTNLAMKIIYFRNTVKNFSLFTDIPVNIFLLGVRKDICTASFLTPKNCILKANVFIFLYISVRKFVFQRRSKILSA